MICLFFFESVGVLGGSPELGKGNSGWVPLVTVPFKAQFIGSLGEPEFHGHFEPQTNQYTIH